MPSIHTLLFFGWARIYKSEVTSKYSEWLYKVSTLINGSNFKNYSLYRIYFKHNKYFDFSLGFISLPKQIH